MLWLICVAGACEFGVLFARFVVLRVLFDFVVMRVFIVATCCMVVEVYLLPC